VYFIVYKYKEFFETKKAENLPLFCTLEHTRIEITD